MNQQEARKKKGGETGREIKKETCTQWLNRKKMRGKESLKKKKRKKEREKEHIRIAKLCTKYKKNK